ncbi:MAG: hypothetical protein ACYCX4_01475 [Bacillota bacterium]
MRKPVMEYVIHQGDIQPVYQPIFDLKENHIIGYEALARTIQGYSPETLLIPQSKSIKSQK